jgi:hypothetical protein
LVQLYLVESSGSLTLIQSTTTNSSGRFTFTNLVLGLNYSYQIPLNTANINAMNAVSSNCYIPDKPSTTPTVPGASVTVPNPNPSYPLTPNPANPNTPQLVEYPFTITNLNNPPGLGSGFTVAAYLGQYVWYDQNGDGYQDEPASNGLSNVTVSLYNGANNVLLTTTTTNSLGYYYFLITPATSYIVGINLLDNPSLTGLYPTVSSTDYSSGNVSVGVLNMGNARSVSPVVTVPFGNPQQSQLGIDFGFTSMTIGNYVWNDTNFDGLQEVNEPGIPGITVDLYKNGVLVASTITDSTGHYVFTNVLTDTAYTVAITPNHASNVNLFQDDSPTIPNVPPAGSDSVGIPAYSGLYWSYS